MGSGGSGHVPAVEKTPEPPPPMMEDEAVASAREQARARMRRKRGRRSTILSGIGGLMDTPGPKETSLLGA